MQLVSLRATDLALQVRRIPGHLTAASAMRAARLVSAEPSGHRRVHDFYCG